MAGVNNKILYIIIIFLIISNIYFIIKYETGRTEPNESISKYDTTYNHIILDSIRYNIITRDSTITKIRYHYEDSIIKASLADDSTSIAMFKRLASEK